MIFKQWQQVLDGTKTQTRRPCYTGAPWYDAPWRGNLKSLVTPTVVSINMRTGKSRTRWEEGKTYAVQPGRGKKAVGRIRITKIRRERLQEIKPEEFRREGLISGAPIMVLFFIELWDGIYHKPYRWEDNPEVWVLDFDLVELR